MAKKFCPNHPENKLWAKGVCIYCYRKQYAKKLTPSPLKPLSDKQRNILNVYSNLRRLYLKHHPTCEIGLDNCQVVATEIHHTAKKYSKKLWLDTTKFRATCRSCHTKIENSPNLAKQLGLYNYKAAAEKEKMDETDQQFYEALEKESILKLTV